MSLQVGQGQVFPSPITTVITVNGSGTLATPLKHTSFDSVGVSSVALNSTLQKVLGLLTTLPGPVTEYGAIGGTTLSTQFAPGGAIGGGMVESDSDAVLYGAGNSTSQISITDTFNSTLQYFSVCSVPIVPVGFGTYIMNGLSMHYAKIGGTGWVLATVNGPRNMAVFITTAGSSISSSYTTPISTSPVAASLSCAIDASGAGWVLTACTDGNTYLAQLAAPPGAGTSYQNEGTYYNVGLTSASNAPKVLCPVTSTGKILMLCADGSISVWNPGTGLFDSTGNMPVASPDIPTSKLLMTRGGGVAKAGGRVNAYGTFMMTYLDGSSHRHYVFVDATTLLVRADYDISTFSYPSGGGTVPSTAPGNIQFDDTANTIYIAWQPTTTYITSVQFAQTGFFASPVMNLSDTSPLPASGGANVKWDKDSNATPIPNLSAYIPAATISAPGVIQLEATGNVYKFLNGKGAWTFPLGGVSGKTTNYTAVQADHATLVTFNSSSAVTLTLPNANTLQTNYLLFVENRGTGILTVTPTTSTIDGGSSLQISQNQGCVIFGDGTNYFTMRGIGLTSGVNKQTGTSYTIVSSDNAKLVSIGNAAAVAVTLPNANTLPSGFAFAVENTGAGTVTLTPTTSTIDALASLALTQNQGVDIYSDGTNYYTMRGFSSAGGGSAWHVGSGVPGVGLGADGDMYLNTANGDIYQKVSGSWGSPVANITGPAGAAGATGPQGPSGTNTIFVDEEVPTGLINGSNVIFTLANIPNPQASLDLFRKLAAGSGYELITNYTLSGNTITMSSAPATGDLLLANYRFGTAVTGVCGITIDGGTVLPSVGSRGYLQVPFACTITAWTLIGNTSGNARITVKKCTDAAFPTTTSIVAAAPPQLVAQQKAESSTLTGWTTSIGANDILEFVLESVVTCTRLTLELKYQRS